ncbi:glycosyltransferase family 2 protein [Legionella longbeachae]|uniref:Putative lipopolysaccharide biosynthesis glycosyltransferase n=1 Tax=Legionella longbeachae serogroup 1 (strain NSW150) TaxID=661367 RepID=D3HJ46_LEGLN|nr:glycosyltransferase family 2 protein [Legionella longbeachae]VEE02933.1 lipopolysaccharide biosynthesis glycosyltransferase [Legionella oakridgensis]HBD7398864.1 glycosyltransferase family 2 protein [Legionella pneumophila]ARB90829.1 glycosyltransferase family 2 protein [Legionella longbeachae]ARM32745.1 glycosyltransferase family 2 protein [Legionella longbeachae]EEZ94467.1 glycosyl transferase domain protein [Legionella longbeachae D-4968]
MSLSVIIITKNEEQNIRRCLESVQFADEIIVLDSGSTDNTVAISKEYTEHVYSTDWPGYGAQKQRALSKAQCDWVLNLDADESVSQELQQEMIQAMASDSADAFRVAIQMYFYNQPLKYSSSPKRHARLFKRVNTYFSDDIVHEKIVLPEGARIGQIKTPIMHHSFKDVSHMLYKLNKYSSYSAKTYIAKQKRASLSKTLAGTLWMFFRCYVVQRGFLDGKRGFLFAVFNAQGTFYRGIKQIYRDKNLDQLPSLAQNAEELI